MPIENSNPVVIPPVQQDQKEYPHWWIRSIHLQAPTTTSGTARFILCPYNSDTGEILDQRKSIIVPDLWTKINESPEFQQAMVAIFAAVDTIKDD